MYLQFLIPSIFNNHFPLFGTFPQKNRTTWLPSSALSWGSARAMDGFAACLACDTVDRGEARLGDVQPGRLRKHEENTGNTWRTGKKQLNNADRLCSVDGRVFFLLGRVRSTAMYWAGGRDDCSNCFQSQEKGSGEISFSLDLSLYNWSI